MHSSSMCNPRMSLRADMWRAPRDSLLLDCVPLSKNSTVAECFVEGLQIVDECKPANDTGSSLENLVDSGAATDGDEGSLCSLVPTADKVSSPDGALWLCLVLIRGAMPGMADQSSHS